MDKTHHYTVAVKWTGNTGEGTKNYTAYQRSHTIVINNKVALAGSSDAAFRGDKNKHSPEDLFVSAIASCHMLWYLHLCSDAGIIVTAYEDAATGIMTETSNGGGRFTEVMLCPKVTVTNALMVTQAEALHQKANELCFIANSCNFPIHHKAVIVAGNNL